MKYSDYPLRCLVSDNKPIDIHLILTHHWYDEIDAGRKWVDYREQSNYYKRMFLRNYKLLKERHGDKNTPLLYLYKNVRSVIFHRGYTSTTMRWEVKNIKVSYGIIRLGAPFDRPVFCIYLGKRYKKSYKVTKLHQ